MRTSNKTLIKKRIIANTRFLKKAIKGLKEASELKEGLSKIMTLTSIGRNIYIAFNDLQEIIKQCEEEATRIPQTRRK